MDKREAHYQWTKIRKVKPWYFLIPALIATLFCVFSLRANNEHMIVLRQAVYSADKNNGNVNAALKNLQAYVTTHMNTNLSNGTTSVYPPIQLQYTYQRLVDAQKAAESNDQLYTAAQHYCEKLDPVDFSGHNRVPCIEQYVQSHGGAKPANIPDALYKFDFVSPRWSPDLAGWSMLAAIILWLAFIIDLLIGIWFRHYTK